MLENDSSPGSGRERLAFFLGTGPGRGDALRPLAYLGSGAMVVLALGCGLLIERFIGLQSILLVFLMAVIGAAIAWGLFPSLFACVLSVVAFNFFLLPPLYTFTIADPENAVALFFFFVVALIVSNLTAALRSQIVIAQSRAETTAALYAFSRKLAGIGTLDDLLWATTRQISSMLDVSTVLLLPAATRTATARRARSARTRRTTGSTRPIWRRAPLLGARRCRRGDRAGSGAGFEQAVSADAHRPARSASSASRERPAAVADAGRAPPARRPRGPGGGRDRARVARRRGGRGRGAGRDRAAARGPADLDLARSAHAARLDPRHGVEPAQLCRTATTRRSAKNCWRPCRRRPSV